MIDATRREQVMHGVIQLHALVLAAFAAAWLWDAVPHEAVVKPALLARMQKHARKRSPRMSIKLHFLAMDAVTLRRLAPASLQRDAVVVLRTALREAARDAFPGHTCLIRLRVDRRTRGITPGPHWATQREAPGQHAPLDLRIDLRILLKQAAKHARLDGLSRDPARISQMQIDAQGTASVAMLVAGSSGVGAALMNGSRALLQTLAQELVAGCSIHAAPQPPPSRVNIGWVTSVIDPPGMPSRQTAIVLATRSRLERMLRRVWGRAAPPVASHIFSTWSGPQAPGRSIDSRGGQERACGSLLTRQGAAHWIRAVGAMPSIASSQPLSLVLYDAAHPPGQACTTRGPDGSGASREAELLAHGSALLLPGHGGLLVFSQAPCTASPSSATDAPAAHGAHAGADRAAAAHDLACGGPSGSDAGGSDSAAEVALTRLVRTLLGLRTFPPQPDLAAASSSVGGRELLGGTGADASWLEAMALQVSCAQAELRSASAELLALQAAGGVSPTLASRSDIARIRTTAEQAVGQAGEAARRLAAGDTKGACEAAHEAHRLMLWASRHEALLPGQEMPPDVALAVYAPLFLPVSATVLSAARSGARHRS